MTPRDSWVFMFLKFWFWMMWDFWELGSRFRKWISWEQALRAMVAIMCYLIYTDWCSRSEEASSLLVPPCLVILSLPRINNPLRQFIWINILPLNCLFSDIWLKQWEMLLFYCILTSLHIHVHSCTYYHILSTA